jgi:hypothetical protein
METTDRQQRACVAISKPVYIRACLFVNHVNLMQLIVAYSLCGGNRGKGRAWHSVGSRRKKRTGIRSGGCSQKHCGAKGSVKNGCAGVQAVPAGECGGSCVAAKAGLG